MARAGRCRPIAWFACSVLAVAGCHWNPARRGLDASLYPVPGPAERAATPAPAPTPSGPTPSVPGSESVSTARNTLPPLPDLIPITDREALAAAPEPTPLLDAALLRAQELRRLSVGDSEPTEPPPRPILISETEPPRRATEPAPEHEAALRLLSPDEWAVSCWGPAFRTFEPIDPSNNSTPEAPAPSNPSATLAILELRLCRSVDGLGRFEELDSRVIGPGSSVLVYCELESHGPSEAESSGSHRLASTVELVDAAGESVWRQTGLVEPGSASRDPRFFVNYKFQVPTGLEPGAYRLRVEQIDLTTRSQAVSSLDLDVSAQPATAAPPRVTRAFAGP